MANNRLYRDMIRDTRMWNLYLGLDRTSIDVMAYCPMEDNSLLSATIQLDENGNDYCKAIEEAIYDNPLLLNDFNKVTIVSRGNSRAILPGYLSENQELAADIAAEICGRPEGFPDAPMITDHLPLLECNVAHFMETDVYHFLTRTFTGVKFIHRLSSLTRFFHGTNRGPGSMLTFVNLRAGSMDIILFTGDRLLLANTYEWSTPEDVIYYIMAVRQAFEVPGEKSVVLSGDRNIREELTPRLREFIPSVIPAIFPTAMFRAGGMTAMNTPTDLVVLPLCE
ncbi:MAG: DUF3822 family protein [Bacteroidales bacterium]|nr:DUF3822 family protein [Bacteroidales bacterium]